MLQTTPDSCFPSNPAQFVWFDRVFGAVKKDISGEWDPFGQ